VTTLVTTDGKLIPAGTGPYQVTAGGRRSLSTPSVPFARYGSNGLTLIGDSHISYGRLYREQPWVHITVNKLARAISRLPLKVYERDSQGAKRRLHEGRLYDLLEHPAPRRAPVTFKQWLALGALLHGNSVTAFYRPEKAGPPARVWPLDWRFLSPVQLMEGGPIEAWETTEFGERVFVAAEDAIHVAWEPPDGRIGVSPLQALGVTVRLEDAAQRYQANSFRNAARPSGAVVLPKEAQLTTDERAELRADIRSMHEGIDNAYRVALLTGGADWKPMAHTAVEAELIEQRKLNREEAAAVYDIPPPLIGILDKATYSNIETQHRMFYTDVLGPWLTLIEETVQAQLIDPEPAFAGQFVEFDLNEVLRGDPVKRAESLKTQVASGVLTINEARDLENRPRIDHPDADTALIPINNLAPIGTPSRDVQPGGRRATDPPVEDPEPDE
jgi:HK97 family phage portal protein